MIENYSQSLSRNHRTTGPKKIISVLVLLLAGASLFVACSKKAQVEGKVLDNFGQPLPDARVEIANSSYHDITDNSGKYSVDYSPGSFAISFRKEGYSSHSVDVSLSERTKHPMADQFLFKYPPTEGISVIEERDYLPLNQGTVFINTSEVPKSQLRYVKGEIKRTQTYHPGDDPVEIMSCNPCKFLISTQKLITLFRANGNWTYSTRTAFQDSEYRYDWEYATVNDPVEPSSPPRSIIDDYTEVEYTLAPGRYTFVELNHSGPDYSYSFEIPGRSSSP